MKSFVRNEISYVQKGRISNVIRPFACFRIVFQKTFNNVSVKHNETISRKV